MKASTLFSSLLAAALAPVVSAQAGCVSSAQSLVPSCGQSCLLSAKSALGCTVETDYACGCSQSSALQNNAALTQCVLSACDNNIETALQVSSGAQQICSCVATATAAGAGPTTGASSAEATSAPAAGSTPAASEPEASSGSGATSMFSPSSTV